MKNETYFIVNSCVLPKIYSDVVYAKELLASGIAPNASKAVKMAGISRSAFYKYRNYVFKYDSGENNTVDFNAVLSDKAGVFSAMTTVLYEQGANILTVTQSKPVDGVAAVTLTVNTDNIKISLDDLLALLRNVNGIISVKAN